MLAATLAWLLIAVSPNGAQTPIASYATEQACTDAAASAVGLGAQKHDTYRCVAE